MDVETLAPVTTLRERIPRELRAAFRDDRLTRLARAAGRLDVMGGSIEATGGLTLSMPLAASAGVAVQRRDDGQVEVFSFDLLDDHRPFQFRMPAQSLSRPIEALRRDFAERGRAWAASTIAPLAILVAEGVAEPSTLVGGFTIAVKSDAPCDAAIGVAMMAAIVDELNLADLIGDPLRLARLCRQAQEQVAGRPGSLADGLVGRVGDGRSLLKVRCQHDDESGRLPMPDGVEVVGLDLGPTRPDPTLDAARVGHAILLAEMRRMADEAGKVLSGDPTGGHLANVDPADYKRFFRPRLPEAIAGRDVRRSYGDIADVEDDVVYPVQAALDHHVLEAQRVRRFADFLGRVDAVGRSKTLRSAGHLMYASHKSQRDNAGLASDAGDQLVALVQQRESAGLYGARLCGGGGMAAVLLERTPRAQEGLASVVADLHVAPPVVADGAGVATMSMVL